MSGPLAASRAGLVDDVVGVEVTIDGMLVIADRLHLIEFPAALGIRQNIPQEDLRKLVWDQVERDLTAQGVLDHSGQPQPTVAAMIETLSRDFSGFDICFAGHNHTPFLATAVGVMIPHDGHRTFRIPKGHKAYVCVGSVGQPRDHDTRASFATLDGEQLTFHRLAYDVAKTQEKILRHGLSPFLAERLGEGI